MSDVGSSPESARGVLHSPYPEPHVGAMTVSVDENPRCRPWTGLRRSYRSAPVWGNAVPTTASLGDNAPSNLTQRWRHCDGHARKVGCSDRRALQCARRRGMGAPWVLGCQRPWTDSTPGYWIPATAAADEATTMSDDRADLPILRGPLLGFGARIWTETLQVQ